MPLTPCAITRSLFEGGRLCALGSVISNAIYWKRNLPESIRPEGAIEFIWGGYLCTCGPTLLMVENNHDPLQYTRFQSSHHSLTLYSMMHKYSSWVYRGEHSNVVMKLCWF